MKSKIRYVPRWVAETLVIPQDVFPVRSSFASPIIFANTDLWPMNLQWMSITGTYDPWLEETDGRFALGGVGRQIEMRLGISQKSTVNLTHGLIQSFACSNSFKHQLYDPRDSGLQFKFPMEYELAPDSGLVAQIASNDSSYSVDRPSITINGIRDDHHGQYDPVQMAATFQSSLSYPSSYLFDSADLFNSGSDPMFLKEMILKPGQMTIDTNTVFDPSLNKTLWRINPNNDIPWMPQDELIPVGNIAPFNRANRDWWDQGPNAYVFPQGTKLEPRQRLSIELRSAMELAPDTEQTITICLFGLMEVQ